MAPRFLLGVCVLVALASVTVAYKHVVFMHGIMAGPEEWDLFEKLVQKYHPGTPMTAIDMYNKVESLQPMWSQVEAIAKNVTSILTNKTSEGTILICYSQGGLVCRGLLSLLEHNVETFIALSSPLAGQFGDTSYLKYLFPTFLRDSLYKILYTQLGQDTSVGNYWYDPHHVDLFAKYSAYLGMINGQSSFSNPNIKTWKSNFLRVKNMVLVGGPDDGVITPWQSSHFGMYDNNTVVQPMQNQSWFVQDSFGLKTLSQKGAIHLHTVKGIAHHYWHLNVTVFESYIKPWLS